MKKYNIHSKTVKGFSDEWERFDQSSLPIIEKKRMFDLYFHIFPWSKISKDSVGFDLGCGSGRWAELVAPKIKKLHCIDPSSAIEIAKKNNSKNINCIFHKNGVDDIPLDDGSMDFGYSLGVLHHIPDTQKGLISCVRKLKPGAPFLVYLYYAFDNRPTWFRLIWKLSNYIRKIISKLPYPLRYILSQIIAAVIYVPLARSSLLFEKLNFNISSFPLSYYRRSSFYTMRTDSLDRFGTILERRFTKKQVKNMMQTAGLENIVFSDESPYWCAVGFVKK